MLKFGNKSLREFLFSNWDGCLDGSCIVRGTQAGLHTNGSCKCFVNAGRSQLNMIGQKLQTFLTDNEKQPKGNEPWKFELLRIVSRYDMADCLMWTEDDLEFAVLCNDVFFWGGADCEDVFEEDLPALEQAFIDAGFEGDTLYCARKREMRPQGAMYGHFDPKHWHLFDSAGPERDPKDFGNTAKPK